MKIVERYIFRMATVAFLATLCVLTAVVWVTQALREVDLLTAQGQTFLLFLYLTVLALPALIMVIGPVALFIASLYALNRLNADNELVIINAAGASQWHIVKPFLALAVAVSLLIASISIVLMPESARTLRNLVTQVRADVLTFIVVEGRFTTVEDGLTFHIRERAPDGTLRGLLVHDEREPTRVMTYLAEDGRIVRSDDNAYLVMESGSLHQRGESDEELSIVNFDRYVFDLSSLAARTGRVSYHPREMRLGELLDPDPDNSYYERMPGRFRSELHERLSSILYPLAFTFVALAALGDPRTNRQGRGNSILLAVLVVAGLRTIGFAATNMASSQAWAVIPMYTTPLVGIVGGAWLAFSQQRYMSRLSENIPTPAETLRRLGRMVGLGARRAVPGARRR